MNLKPDLPDHPAGRLADTAAQAQNRRDNFHRDAPALTACGARPIRGPVLTIAHTHQGPVFQPPGSGR